MDSLITAAARALAAGDSLGALKRVALRDDAPALALRGIAMAQLGDFARAKELLRGAARAFAPKEAVARARCVVAEAEIALASRDLGWPAKTLDAACATLEAHGHRLNAAYARYLEVRRLVLIGHLDEAERMLAGLDPSPFPPAWRTVHALVVAGIAMQRLRTKEARDALSRADSNARDARIPALTAEVESASRMLNTPAARLIARGGERLLLLDDVEALLASKALVVDACRNAVRNASTVVSLARRPVLFALARALGEACPGDVPRDVLLARAFGARFTDESHRARLRVDFVTGVTWVDGELWHATWEGDDSDLRRVDLRTGEVLESLDMPHGVHVSGLESDGGDQFFCGGEKSGKVRVVRRPRRRAAAAALTFA